MTKSSDPGLLLNGLDGSNPLGFLAAVGALCTLERSDRHRGWRMKWVMSSGWHPVLSAEMLPSQSGLLAVLEDELKGGQSPVLTVSKDLGVDPKTFRRVAKSAQSSASPPGRRTADFVAAFGCDALAASDGKTIRDTALRTMSGAGHQHFLGTMSELVGTVVSEHLRRTLFEPWDYADCRLGLRWDPEEDRRYALRWGNPSGVAPQTMHGANRLAMEALSLLPTIPVGRQLASTGFSRREGTTFFTWPIWDGELNADLVRSLLAHSELQKPEPNRGNLQSMGVADVLRCERVTVGKFRNLTRSEPA